MYYLRILTFSYKIIRYTHRFLIKNGLRDNYKPFKFMFHECRHIYVKLFYSIFFREKYDKNYYSQKSFFFNNFYSFKMSRV